LELGDGGHKAAQATATIATPANCHALGIILATDGAVEGRKSLAQSSFLGERARLSNQ
jgi:hypothetical protein